MRPCPDRFIFDDNGIKLANIYNPAVMSEPVALPAPFNIMADLFGQQVPEVLAQLFARAFPVEVERKFVVQRLAAIVQTPMKRAKHALFLVGEGGTGKSTISMDPRPQIYSWLSLSIPTRRHLPIFLL